MPILTKQFYRHEKGKQDETFYSLCRDTDTGRVFIIHEWFNRENVGSAEMTIPEFQAKTQNGSAWTHFLELIGSLATNPYDANRV